MKRNSLNNQADPDEKEAVVALVRFCDARTARCVEASVLSSEGRGGGLTRCLAPAQVHCLKEAGEIFAVNEGRIKTSFTFSYEKLDQGTLPSSFFLPCTIVCLVTPSDASLSLARSCARTALNSLSQAVQSGSRDEATTQARVIVDVPWPPP
jgi:hypothetical protein